MSRRKQSHPKSLKRKSVEELLCISNEYGIPGDVLRLDDSGDLGGSVKVCAHVDLTSGLIIGRYDAAIPLNDAQLQESSSPEEPPVNNTSSPTSESQHYIKFPFLSTPVRLSKNGRSSGKWLTLLHTQPSHRKTVSTNVTLNYDGISITCVCRCDIAAGEELLAELRTTTHHQQQQLGTDSADDKGRLKTQKGDDCSPDNSTVSDVKPAVEDAKEETETGQVSRDHDVISPLAMVIVKSECVTPPTRTPSPPPRTPSPPTHPPVVVKSYSPTINSHHHHHHHQSSPLSSPSRAGHYAVDTTTPTGSPTQDQHSPHSCTDPAPAPQDSRIHSCSYCCVKFSSLSTLEAHVNYYCVKRPDVLPYAASAADLSYLACSTKQQQQQQAGTDRDCDDYEEAAQQQDAKNHVSPHAIITNNVSCSPKRATKRRRLSSLSSAAPASKAQKQDVRCDTCDDVSSRQGSLSRHDHHEQHHLHNRRGSHVHPHHEEEEEHNGTHSHAEYTRSSPSPDRLSAMFCNECNIQFTSMKTFTGHKEFYCSQRRGRTAGGATVREEYHSVVDNMPSHGNHLQNKHQVPSMRVSHLLHGPTLPPSGADGLFQPAAALVLAAPFLGAPTSINANVSLNVPTVIMQPVLSPNVTVPVLAHQTQPTTAVDESSKPYQQSPHPPTRQSAQSSRTSLSTFAGLASGHASDTSSDQPLDLSNKRKSSPPLDTRQSTKSPKSPAWQNHKLGAQRGSLREDVDQLRLRHSSNGHQKNSAALVMPTKNISKCIECNIVFYKHDNYIIHKQHYCRGRQRACSPKAHTDSEQDVSWHDRRLVNTSDHHNTDSQHPAHHICSSCKIKFSSADTLQCHLQYYCPHGNHQEAEAPADQNAAAHKCILCNQTFLTVYQMQKHKCVSGAAGESSPKSSINVPLLECPYCEYSTHSDARLVEHIKAHSPTRSYKCTVCGYRGNTMRGMKMHGKVHADNAGESFTDENIVVIEQPALIPKRIRAAASDVQFPCADGSVNERETSSIEAELIRMKNEPYKRRRSRKGYEKAENMPATAVMPALFDCIICRQVFADHKALSVHIASHMSPENNNRTPLGQSLSRTNCVDMESACNDTRSASLKIKQNADAQPLSHSKLSSPASCHSSGSRETEHRSTDGSRTKNYDPDGSPNNRSSATADDSSPNASLAVSPPPLANIKREQVDDVEVEPVDAYHQPFNKTIKTSPTTRSPSPLQPVSPLTPTTSPAPPTPPTPPRASVSCVCDTCGVPFKYKSTYFAHKKYYCTAQNHL